MAPSIERYLNVRQAYCPALSADGAAAFLTDITGFPQVWQTRIAPAAGEPLWPDQLTFGPDRVLGVWAAPRGARLIFARDTGGNENAQLFLLENGEERPLTSGHDGAMHTFGEWSADGSRFCFAANRRRPDCFDLYMQGLDGEAEMLWQHDERGYLFRQTWSPDEGRVAVVRGAGSFEHDLFEIDLATRAVRNLTPPGDPVRFKDVCYAADGRSLFVSTDWQSDVLYLAQLDLATSAIEPIVQTEWDIELIACSPDGDVLAYVVNDDGNSMLHARTIQDGATRAAVLPSTPGVVGFFDSRLQFSQDGRRLAFSHTSATRVSDIYLWDLKADRVQPLTRSSHGGLQPSALAAPTLIRYPTFDGRQIPAWLFKPAAARDPAPCVVVVHGGPEAQFLPYFNFLVQYLVANGYAVLAPNVRGSTGYGKAYSHLDDRRLRMDSVSDLEHAARWLKQQPGIDGQRLAVYGGSYGGFMVLAALTTQPEMWAAGVDVVGISNFRTFLENTSAYRRAHRAAEYGSLEHDREFLERVSPINHVDQIRVPLLVIHGANDPRVPVTEARQMVAALEARNVPVRLLVFDDEGHGIVKLKNKLVAFPAIVEFLVQHLAMHE